MPSARSIHKLVCAPVDWKKSWERQSIMEIFCEFKKVTQDKSIFINSTHVVMICSGDAQGTTTIELAGQRTFDVRGTVDMTKAMLEKVTAGHLLSASENSSGA